ncbi:MAG: LexA repressor [Phycisphaerae bacterium]|nr:LexA repressor [Phycisphaerae bacterium]
MKKSSTKKTRRAEESAAGQAGPEDFGRGIAERLTQLRVEYAGDRGRARFAEKLGLTPSTYGNYEKGRTPPPLVLVKAADLTGADLRWLITGRPREEGGAGQSAADPRHRAVLERAAALLADRPANLAALVAFLDLLEQKTLLERSVGIVQGQGGAAAGEPVGETAEPAAPAREGASPFGRWVPVFGRAAAGLARFWAELREGSPDVPEASALDRMIAEAAAESDPDSQLAVLELPPVGPTPGRSRSPKGRPSDADDITVRLVQLTRPITDFQLTEFLEAPRLAERLKCGPLLGLRIDGDSMAPMMEEGDIVLLSPGEPARPGRAAVVRLAGQIGMTCKLYRPRGEMVRLVPANDRYESQEFPARQLEWALAVLGRVRLG